MMGAGCPVPVPLVAKWAAPGLRKPDIRVFMPGRLLTNSRVEPVRPRGPVDVVGLARADCLVSLPEGTREVEQGQPVDVFMTGGMPWSGE
jgi:molybdopterin biosynthesis enzyme